MLVFLALVTVQFGLILPHLVSSKSTALATFGLVLGALSIFCIGMVTLKSAKDLITELSNFNKEDESK